MARAVAIALIVAVGGFAAYVLVLYAMRMAPASHVAPAREVSMLFAALIGGRLLGEGCLLYTSPSPRDS